MEKQKSFFMTPLFGWGARECTGVCAGAHVPNSGIWQFSQFCENAHSYPPSVKFVQKCAQIGQKVAFFGQKCTTFLQKPCFFDFVSQA